MSLSKSLAITNPPFIISSNESRPSSWQNLQELRVTRSAMTKTKYRSALSISMRKRLNRVPKIGGVPMTRATAKSLSHAAKDVLTGQKATLKEREERLWICSSCPERQQNRCGLCGCFLKGKSMLKNSKCPIGKWSTLLREAAVNDASRAETNEERANNPTQVT